MTEKAIILHTVQDADHCVTNGLGLDALLFSSHANVDVYFKEVYNMECKCLSNFISTEEQNAMLGKSSDSVDCLLQYLDNIIAPALNKQFNLNMKYFTPLYSYLGKHYYASYLFFINALEKITVEYRLKKIIIYNYKFNDFFDISSDINKIAPILLDKFDFEIIESDQDNISQNENIDRFLVRIRKAMRHPDKYLKAVIDKASSYIGFNRINCDRKTIVVYGDLYELDFLKANLQKYNILFYRINDGTPLGFDNKKFVADLLIDEYVLKNIDQETGSINKIFLEDIVQDFTCNMVKYFNSIISLSMIEKKYPIALGIWGNSPCEKTKALIFEYLMSREIPIIGAQHGGSYGDSYALWHFESDYNRCNYFISYGFTKDDLQRVYPDKIITTRIVSLGKVKLATKKASKTDKAEVDILFPLAINESIFCGGMSRIPPHVLTRRQVRLLLYLDSLRNKKIYIKPFPYSNFNNCSVIPIIKKLNNVKVVFDITLNDFIEDYNPKAVVIEFPSTPLYEVLPLDTDIFLMNDPVSPFEGKALKELQKRVYYCEDTDELIAKIDLFVNGKPEKKRDDTFYHHYIYKENTKQNIMKLIDDIVDGRNIIEN